MGDNPFDTAVPKGQGNPFDTALPKLEDSKKLPNTSGVPALKLGMSDDEIIKAFGYDPAEIKNVNGYTPGMFAKAITDPNSVLARYTPSILTGIGHGVSDMHDAYKEGVAHLWNAIGGNGGEAGIHFADLVHKFKEADYNQNMRGRAPGETGFDPSTMIPQAGLAALAPEVKAVPALSTVIQGAAMGAATPTDGSGNYALNKANQIGMSAAGGAAGDIAAQRIVGPLVNKVIPSLPNRLLVGKNTPAAQGIFSNLESQGVDATPSEILTAAKVATPAESVVDAKGAMGNLADALAANTAKTPFRGLARLQAATGDKEASDLVNAANGASSTSPLDVAQTSGAIQLKRTQLIKNALWDAVDKKAGPDPILLGNTAKTIQDLRASMQKNGPIPGLSDELDRLQKFYYLGRDEAGRTVPATADRSFADIKLNLVQRMNDIIGGPADTADAKALQRAAKQIKGSLEKDMEEGAQKQGPGVWDAYQRANNFHKDVYIPSMESGPINFQNLFATQDASNPAFADELLKKMVPNASGADRATALGNVLGQKGRAALAQSIVEDAIQKGGVDRTGTWVPGGSASALSKRMDTLNALLPNGAEKTQAQGALNMLQNLAKASPENASALGERFAQVAEGAPAAAGSMAKMFNFVKNGGIDVLFNSPKGKQILFGFSQTKPGTPASNKLMQKMFTLVGSDASVKALLGGTAALPMAAQGPTLDNPGGSLQLADLRNQVPQ